LQTANRAALSAFRLSRRDLCGKFGQHGAVISRVVQSREGVMKVNGKLVLSACFLAFAFAPIAGHTAEPAKAAPDELFRRIQTLDRDLFAAFNACDIKKLASYFDSKLEFYHDKGGVTWTRARFISDVKKNVCGKFTRELVAGSMEVWPLGDYGAVYSGSHVFCKTGAAHCEGIGRFMHIWETKAGKWRITRVISYDHRENRL
jgi:Domain of unknown function (DUF4440)